MKIINTVLYVMIIINYLTIINVNVNLKLFKFLNKILIINIFFYKKEYINNKQIL